MEKIAANLSAIKGELRLGIAATLVTSIQNAIQRSAAARDVLSIAAVCAPNTPISIGLLRDALPDLGDDFATAMLALRGASLLAGTDSNTQLAVEMHPLVSDVVIAELAIDQKIRASQMIALLLRRAEGPGDLAHQNRLTPDIAQARWFIASVESESTVMLGLLLGRYFSARGSHASAKQVEQCALRTAVAEFGRHDFRTYSCMDNLANSLARLGECDNAESLALQALDGHQALEGQTSPAALKSKSNLAMIRRLRGSDESTAVLGVLEMQRQTLGDEHPNTLTSMLNYAATLKPDGDLNAALDMEETVLRIRERDLGPEHDDTLLAANNLASTHHLLGAFSESRRLHERVLIVQCKKHGENHLLTLTSRNNLALAIQGEGDYSTACALLEEVLEAKKHHAEFGPEHPSTLTTQANLAVALFDRGDKVRSVALSESTMATANRTLDIADPVRRNITRIHNDILRRNQAR